MPSNPLLPTYLEKEIPSSLEKQKEWQQFEPAEFTQGYEGSDFFFDNEKPVHKNIVRNFEVQNGLVTNGEYLEFMNDKGYARPELWLSNGWSTVQQENWRSPLYWKKEGNEWFEFTLHGLKKLDLHAPVSHISYFEADAFASWKGARLPLESEWEFIAKEFTPEKGFMDDGIFHPVSNSSNQFLGSLWEWTGSPYVAYPGYKALKGAIGEYNGKFMCDQWV